MGHRDSPFRAAHAAFALDLRSLALFRVVLGLTILLDLASRWSGFGAFYAADGIVPHGTRVIGVPLHFQAFVHLGSDPATHLLMALTAVAALLLTIGWRARTAAFVCWILVGSLNARNELILHLADGLLLLLLLWACLLPIAARGSLDARMSPPTRRKSTRSPPLHLSVAAAGLHLQVVLLYLSSGIFKLRHPTWLDGSHLYQTLSRFEYVKPFGLLLYEQAWLLPLLTWSVLLIQVGGALLLLAPWRYGGVRTGVIAGFGALQVGMGATLHLGLFPLVAVAGSLALLPPWFWARVGGKSPAPHAPGAGTLSGVGTLPGAGTLPDAAREEDAAIPHCPRGILSTVRGMFATSVLLFVLFTNANDHLGIVERTGLFYRVERELALTQSWSMFSSAAEHAGWFIVHAELADGREANLLQGGAPPDHARPAVPIRDFPSYRWRIVMANKLRQDRYLAERGQVLRYLVEAWHRTHPDPSDRIVTASLVEMRYEIRPEYRHGEPEPVLLATYLPERPAS